MPENAPFLNQNSTRFYPFENTKKLLLLDITIKVPTEILGCFLSSTTAKYIIFSLALLDGTTVEYAKAENQQGIINILLSYIQDPDPIGVITTEKAFSYPLNFSYEDTKLLDSVLVREPLDHIRNIYIKKKNGAIIKLNSNFIIDPGKNILIDTEIENNLISISALTINEITNYLRRLIIIDPNNAEAPFPIKGQSLSIYGENIIHISANVFDTRITNSELMCPTIFTEGAKGPTGNSGPQGIPGMLGPAKQINCGTKEICDPCTPECGEFDYLCDPPVFPDPEDPPFPDIPDIPELECPVDIDFPEPNDDDDDDEIDCDIFPLAKLEDYALLDIGNIVDLETPGGPGKFIKGIFSSGYPDIPAGPMTEDYAYLVIIEGSFYDDTTHVPYDLPTDPDYVIKFSNIEFENISGGGVDQHSLYFFNGFRNTAISGSMAFNAPAAYSDNVFLYCTDELCKRVFIYETIKEEFTGEWDHGYHGAVNNSSKNAAIIQARNKNLYAVWEDGTKKKIINVNSEKSDFVGNIPTVTIYDITNESKYPSMPLFCSMYFEEDVEKTTYDLLNSSDPEIAKLIYSVCHPLAPLGLSCVSNISVDRTPSISWDYWDDDEFWSVPNITGCFGWNNGGSTKESFYYPFNCRRSWYKFINKNNSTVKVYKDLPTANKNSYFDNITEFSSSTILEIIEQGSKKPPIIKTEPTLYKYYDYYDRYSYGRVSDAIGIFAFTEEVIYNLKNTPITLNRIHMLAVNNNNIDISAFPSNAYEFEISWFYKNNIMYRNVSHGRSYFYEELNNLQFNKKAGYIWGRSLEIKDYYMNENNFILRLYNADGTESSQETLMCQNFHTLSQDQQKTQSDLAILNESPNHVYYLSLTFRVPCSGDGLAFWAPNSPHVVERILLEQTLRPEVEMLSPSLTTPMTMYAEEHPAIFHLANGAEFSTMLNWKVTISQDWSSYEQVQFYRGTTQAVWKWDLAGESSGSTLPTTIPDHETITWGSIREGWTHKPDWVFHTENKEIEIGKEILLPDGHYNRWLIDIVHNLLGNYLIFLGPTNMLNPEGSYNAYYLERTSSDSDLPDETWEWVPYPYSQTVSLVNAPATGLENIRILGHSQAYIPSWYGPEYRYNWYIHRSLEGFYLNADTYILEGDIKIGSPVGDPLAAEYDWTVIGRGRFENGYKCLSFPRPDMGGQIEFPFRRSDIIIPDGDPPLNPTSKYAFEPDTYIEISVGSDGKPYERQCEFLRYYKAGLLLDIAPI